MALDPLLTLNLTLPQTVVWCLQTLVEFCCYLRVNLFTLSRV
jgi:hypothetical protein